MDKKQLEEYVSKLLGEFAGRGYYLYQIGVHPDFKYSVCRDDNLMDWSARRMVDPEEILKNPWAVGMLMYYTYKVAIAPDL